MTGRILAGLKKAAAVACDSEATRAGLLAHSVVPADRAHVVYLGVHPECSPEPDPAADAEAGRLLGPVPTGAPLLLHVGSNIPRKRVDVLLSVFAEVCRALPAARLVKVGGALQDEHLRQARDLGIIDAVVTLPYISPLSPRDRAALAAVYRRCDLVLQPSEAEGFGLPVAEALACGTPVLASDIAVLHEVGGGAAVYRPVGDVPAWSEAALSLLDERRGAADAWRARRDAGLARARLFSWAAHADRLAEIYRDVLSRAVV
jgi:glycosyltransferase involved in cell wall biosynthesis